jgi:hypothetical protein
MAGVTGVKWSDNAYFTPGGDCQIGDTIMGLRGGLNYKFDFPSTGIKDGNGNYLISWNTLGIAATDYLELTNGEVGTNPAITALGTESDIGIDLITKGTGEVNITGLLNVNGSTAINSIINDGTMATATAQNVPTAQSVVDYVTSVIPPPGISWTTVSGTSQAVADNTGYIPLNGSLTTFTLPVTAAVGFSFSIEGLGAGGWTIQANGGQYIRFISTTSGAGGTCSSRGQYDNCSVVCVTADVEFKLIAAGSAGLIFT